MKYFLTLALVCWSAVARAGAIGGSGSTVEFVFENGWTNSVVAHYSDQYGNPVNMTVASGGSLRGLMTAYGGQDFSWLDLTGFNQMVACAGSVGGVDWSSASSVSSDGSTNGMLIEATVWTDSFYDSCGDLIPRTGGNFFQSPQAIYIFGTQAQVTSSISVLSGDQQISYFLGGFGFALPLAITWYACVAIKRGLKPTIVD